MSLDGAQIDRERLRRMVDRSIGWHDSKRNLWIGDSIGLGHTQRANTPESIEETQPWIEPETKLVISAAARIDNRDELLSQLGLEARPIRTDAQLILLGYLKWGCEVLPRLVGDFAFAIWDPRDRELFCARDFIGTQQLYYHQGPRIVLFASELSALMAAGYVPREINADKIAEVLLKRTNNAATTIYQGVQALKPACWMRMDSSATEIREHWKPEIEKEIRLQSSDEYVEAYQELFQQAVESRMRSPFAIGTTLTSGLDSSSVTWCARGVAAAKGKKIHAYSFGDLDDPNTTVEKCTYADAFLQKFPMSHEYRAWGQDGIFSDQDHLLQALGSPFRDVAFDRWIAVCELLRRSGGRTLLSGQGGDLLTTSHAHDYLFGLMFQGRWLRLMREIRQQARNTGRSVRSIVRSELIGPLLKSSLAGPGLAASEYQRSQPLFVVPCIARPEFVFSYFGNARNAPVPTWGDVWRSPVRANQVANLFAGRYQPFYQSLVPLAAIHGVEILCPLLDRRLCEFCLAVPAEQHRFDGWNRYLIRRTMRGILPDGIVWAPRKSSEPTDPWGPFRSQRVERYVLDRLDEYGSDSEVTRYLDLDLLRTYWEDIKQVAHRPFDPFSADVVAESKRRHFSRGFMTAAFLRQHDQVPGSGGN